MRNICLFRIKRQMLDKLVYIGVFCNVFLHPLCFFVVFSPPRQRLPAVETKPRADVQCWDQVGPQAWESWGPWLWTTDYDWLWVWKVQPLAWGSAPCWFVGLGL